MYTKPGSEIFSVMGIGYTLVFVVLWCVAIAVGIYITILIIKALRRAIIALDIYNQKNGYISYKKK